jgi:hypothetical protein
MKKCPYCNGDLKYIEKFNQRYCFSCKQYVQQYMEPRATYTSKKSPNYLHMPTSYKLMITISIIIVIILLLPVIDIFAGGLFISKESEPVENWRDWPEVRSEYNHVSGYSEENSTEQIIIDISEKYVTTASFELVWLDEQPSFFNGVNEPDYFHLSILAPWGEPTTTEEYPNPVSESGEISITFGIPDKLTTSSSLGKWNIEIHCGDCGDEKQVVPPAGSRVIEDTGNVWTLTYHYEYHAKVYI